MRTRRGVSEVVEVFRAEESADANREADAEGGPIHISSSPTYSCDNYAWQLEGTAEADKEAQSVTG